MSNWIQTRRTTIEGITIEEEKKNHELNIEGEYFFISKKKNQKKRKRERKNQKVQRTNLMSKFAKNFAVLAIKLSSI